MTAPNFSFELREHAIRVLLAASLAAAFLAATDNSLAQDQLSSEELRSVIPDVVRPYVEARDFMGVIGIGREGEQPLILAYGLASVELDVPHSVDNIFMIGSVSKQFTGVAILLLEEDGRLSVEDPVSKFLPEFGNGDRITIAQLLTHTSGVEDIYSLDRFGETAGQGGSFQEVVDDLSRAELNFSPGTSYAYSNGGYALLAAIIENASGLAFGEFLEQRIFEPLGMTRSAHDEPSRVIEGRVAGYDPWGTDDLSHAPTVSPAFTTGSGSIWSSASDLLKWSAALHGGQVISDESYGKLTSDYGNGYGFGVSVFERFGRAVVGHDGRVSGFSSDLASYVDDGTAVAILGNVQSVARDEIRRLVAAALFGEDYSAPDRPSVVVQPEASIEELEGVYQFGPGFEVSIFEEQGRLLARANKGGASELIPTADGTWFSRMLYASVRFRRDEDGEVDALLWGAGEGAPTGNRIR